MNRQEKKELVHQLKEQFQKSDSVFFVDYKGLSVKELQEVRRRIDKANADLKVAKVRLIRKAIQDVDSMSRLDPYCKNQLAVVFANDQAQEVLKELHGFSKKYPTLSFVVGYSHEKLLEKEALIRLAELPSREVLLAQIAGTFANMIAHVARLAQALKEQRAAEQKDTN